MRQQVNLYQPILRKERRVFSARTMLTSIGVALAGLMLIYGYASWQVHGLEGRLADLAEQRDAAQRRLASLEQAIPLRRKSELLEAEITRLERELDQQRELIAALERGKLGNAKGFSSHLEGLARQRVEGLWLTGLSISQGGRRLRLNGRALSPERIPRLLQQLSAEPAFAGLHFNTLKMERPDENPKAVEFVLGTVDERKEKE